MIFLFCDTLGDTASCVWTGVTEIHIWSMNLLCVGVRWKHIKDITQKSLVCFWADTAKLCFAFCWFAYILCVFIRQLTHKYHFQVHYQCNILCAFIRQITHIHSLYLYSHLWYYQCKILVVCPNRVGYKHNTILCSYQKTTYIALEHWNDSRWDS